MASRFDATMRDKLKHIERYIEDDELAQLKQSIETATKKDKQIDDALIASGVSAQELEETRAWWDSMWGVFSNEIPPRKRPTTPRRSE